MTSILSNPIHNVLIFSPDYIKQMEFVSFMTNSDDSDSMTYKNNTINFIKLPHIEDVDDTKDFVQHRDIISLLKNISNISLFIACISKESDVDWLDKYYVVFNSFYHSNIVIVMFSKGLIMNRIGDAVLKLVKVNSHLPIYNVESGEKTKNRTFNIKRSYRQFCRESILTHTINMKSISMDTIRIHKNIYLETIGNIETSKSLWYLKNSLIENRGNEYNSIKKIENTFFNLLSNKMILLIRIHSLKVRIQDLNCNKLVAIQNKIWNPYLNEIIECKLRDTIVQYQTIGFEYKIEQRTDRMLRLKITKINSNNLYFSILILYTTSNLFYQNHIKQFSEEITNLNSELNYINMELFQLRKDLNNDVDQFDKIYKLFQTCTDVKSSPYISLSEYSSYFETSQDKETYRIKYESKDINHILPDLKIRLKYDVVSFILIENCDLNNEDFLNILKEFAGYTGISDLTLRNACRITNECVYEVMHAILNTTIFVLNLENTGIRDNASQMLSYFMKQVYRIELIYKSFQDETNLLLLLKKAITNRRDEILNCLKNNTLIDENVFESWV